VAFQLEVKARQLQPSVVRWYAAERSSVPAAAFQAQQAQRP
jgi:hypothetical protein